MGMLILILLPILITDMINPVLLAAVIIGLGSRHPFFHSTLILLSFFLSYFLTGIAVAVGIEYLEVLYRLPAGVDYAIEFLVALLLLYYARRLYIAQDAHPEEELPHEKGMKPSTFFWMGFQVNLVGLPFAVPYLAAIDQILKADLSPWMATVILLAYNLLYLLPFAALLCISAFFHKKSDRIFQTISRRFHDFSGTAVPLLFFLLALVLLEDCISWFLGYREYSFLNVNQ